MWISQNQAATESILPVYKVVDNSELPVDNLWIKPELSTGCLEFGVINRLSTTYPHLIHRVIHRVIHKFLEQFDHDLTVLECPFERISAPDFKMWGNVIVSAFRIRVEKQTNVTDF